MKVSAKAEYACVAMVELAGQRDGTQPVRVKDIADQHGVPYRFLMQTLLHLKTAGLVVSVRGAGGGYQLARPPEQISLADIVVIIDGPPQPPSLPQTGSPALMALRSVWGEMYAEGQRFLEKITLADLARRTQQANVLLYQI